MILIFMTLVNTYAVMSRISTMTHLKFTVGQKLNRLCDAQKLRNGIILELNLLIALILNVFLTAQSNSTSNIDVSGTAILAVIFQSLLGLYFLVFEVLIYDKELRKPCPGVSREKNL